ncbi:Phage major tail tube protein [Collimonas arenae]|uniref:Phage major tail tube protein n=1 Tax=Collimonas arenae TaxID=279058 RepID=A0A0A1FE13_9BURK|nr:phage major tail tube protein [Collimonas arenae]AIY42998.1 Phage major tail tube protein [Collimonas arenae]
MGLPKKLKDFILFDSGNAYKGEVAEVTLPKLSRKMEEYRAGGMSGPVSVDLGNEAINLEWSAGGILIGALTQYGARSHNATQLRFAGAYENDDDGSISAVEIVVRGRHKEIDMGNAKVGDDTTHKYTTACSYYKLTIDNKVIFEFDFINGVEIVDGVDRNAGIRRAIGL